MKEKTKWTQYFQAFCYGIKSPYRYILIQAPRDIADEVMRKGLGLDPNEIDCYEHGGGWWVQENIESPDHLMSDYFANISIMYITEEVVPYYRKGLLKEPIWECENR